MKKYIWLCNTIPKTAAKRYGLNDVLGVSWIDSTLPFFYKDKDTLLYILFPTNDGKLTEIKDGNFIYYPFQNQKKNPYEYNAVLENKFYDLLTDIQPDIIHVFGTEYAHALAMMHAVKSPFFLHLPMENSLIMKKFIRRALQRLHRKIWSMRQSWE